MIIPALRPSSSEYSYSREAVGIPPSLLLAKNSQRRHKGEREMNDPWRVSPLDGEGQIRGMFLKYFQIRILLRNPLR